MKDMSVNIKEAEEFLTCKPLNALTVERAAFDEENMGKYADLPQPLRYGKLMLDMMEYVSVPVSENDILIGRVIERAPTEEEEKKYLETRYASDNPRWAMRGSGHCTFGWNDTLHIGLDGLIELAEKSKETKSGDEIVFLDGAILILKAFKRYLVRSAEAAEAAGKHDAAQACLEAACVPKTFRGAMQLAWTICLIDSSYLEPNPTLEVGRLDRLLIDFYRRDIESGILTEDAAREIITDYYCKHNLNMGRGEHQMGDEGNSTGFDRIFNFDAPQYLPLAGTDETGKSVVNELTQLFVECIQPKFKNPVVLIRYHKNLDTMYPELWKAVIEKSVQSSSMMIYNDDDIISGLIHTGIPEEDARKYAHFGCNWVDLGEDSGWMAHGPTSGELYPEMTPEERKTLDVPNRGSLSDLGSAVSLMELAGKLCEEHDESKLTIDDLYKVFFDAMEISTQDYLKRLAAELKLRNKRPSRQIKICDVFTAGSLRKAMTRSAGGAKYHFIAQSFQHFGTIVDSFTVCDELVFRRHEMTLSHLLRAAEADYIGYEKELSLCRSVEKYGSNSPLSDYHANRLGNEWADMLTRCNKPYIEQYNLFLTPSIECDNWHIRRGEAAGATIDGRRAHCPFSQNQNPMPGSAVRGLTGMLGGMLSVPFDKYCSGGFNLDIDPKQFGDENGQALFARILGSYFNRGGLQAQVSCVNVDELIDAQIHPENHRDLRVRVTGYSGVFVDICPRLQNQIIRRMGGEPYEKNTAGIA